MSFFFNRGKKYYFNWQIKIVQRKVWDEEFRKHRLKEGREELRLQYDRISEQLVLITKLADDEEKKGDIKDQVVYDRLKKQIEELPRDIEQLKKQIDQLDQELLVSDTTMANYQSLLKMLKEHKRRF